MDMPEVVKSKIDRLINIRLTKGVQPSDLANNIYLNNYEKLNFYKIEDKVIGELTFKEKIDDNFINTTLRYIYNKQNVLLRIEEQIYDNIRIEWDRDIIESNLINDIIDILRSTYSNEYIESFIKTLPNDLKCKIEHVYYKVA